MLTACRDPRLGTQLPQELLQQLFTMSRNKIRIQQTESEMWFSSTNLHLLAQTAAPLSAQSHCLEENPQSAASRSTSWFGPWFFA